MKIIKDFKSALLKHDMAAPRYTSYPPATQFSEGEGIDSYLYAIEHIESGSQISLYFHIPFCSKLCYYCGCFTMITGREDRINAYLKMMIQEARLLASKLPPNISVRHMHFGGGSPTLISASRFLELIEEINGIFQILPDAEIAIEADPRQLSEEKIVAYAKSGINRISFGVQDLNDKTLEAVNRKQPFELTKQAVDWCRSHGIQQINFDIMYGLPYQTVQTITETIKTASVLAPSRFAFFGYAHVPWMKKHMKAMDMEAMPDASLRYDLFAAGVEQLAKEGYQMVGIDHFVRLDDPMFQSCKNKKLQRNFQGYTTDTADILLGIGASAISKTSVGYAQNFSDAERYTKEIEAGNLPLRRGYIFAGNDKIIAEIIEQIMCYHEVNISYFKEKYNLSEDFFAEPLAKLVPLINDGLVEFRQDGLSIAPAAYLATRLVAAAFDEFFDYNQASESKDRHARAV